MSTLRQDADGGNRTGRTGAGTGRRAGRVLAPPARAQAGPSAGEREAASGDREAASGGREAASGGRVTGVGVLDRSVLLLDLLAAGPRTLRWLAGASGLPRPTAYRLLVALEAHRLAARDASGAFRLGPRLTELAAAAGPALDLAALAGPVLARLHEATGESVQLYVRSGDRRLCIAARDAGTGLRDSVPVGALLPLDAGSGGKVLRAWSDSPSASAAAKPGASTGPARSPGCREAGPEPGGDSQGRGRRPARRPGARSRARCGG